MASNYQERRIALHPECHKEHKMASVECRCLGQDNFTLENVCRLCLFTNFPMRNIFRTYVASGEEIYKVLNYLFGLEITVNDELPPNICQSCLYKTTAYFAFKRNALLAKSELIEIVDALRIVVPREKTEGVEICNSEATIEEKPLTSDGHVLNASKQNEPENSEIALLVENNEKEVENQGIHFNTLEAQLAMKEEIDIVERNTTKDLRTEHDSMHENETEVIEGQSFLSTENHQPTEMSAAESNDPMDEPTQNEDDNISVGENKENCSHRKVFLRRNTRRNLMEEQQTPSPPLLASCSNSPAGLQKLRRRPQKRKREQDEKDMVVLNKSVDKRETQHQSITTENGPNNLRKEQKEVDVSAKGIDVVCFEQRQSETGNSREEGEYVKCHHCGEKRGTLDGMKEHIYTVHFPLFIGEDTGQSKAKGHECGFCHRVFKHKSSLKRHLMIHTGEKPFKCSFCEYRSCQSYLLKEHMCIHTNDKQFECHLCDYRSSLSSSLKRHLRIHTSDRPYECQVCQYKCSTSSHLKTHLRKHTNDKPFECQVCQYKCNYISHLKTHLRRHTNDRPYECQVCKYKCNYSSDLKKHLRRHTNDRPYECQMCQYKCIDSSSLKRHLRKHTNDRPYECQMCQYKCSTSSNLKRHLRIHTNGRPYECQMCAFRARTSSNLKIHIHRCHQRMNL